MSKKYYTAEKLNEHIERIIDSGFMPPTRLYRFQEGRTAIVIGNELQGAGFIRTYEETVKFMEKRKLFPLTEVQYNEQLKLLQDDLGALRTSQGVLRAERKRLISIIEDMDEYLGTKTNYKKTNTKKLYEAVKQANLSIKGPTVNSPKFYEYLHEILGEI